MKVVNRDLWEAYGVADAIFVTSNACVNKQGELVMGRGAARELKRRFPDYPSIVGTWLRKTNLEGKRYGIFLNHVSRDPAQWSTLLGVFQVKYHWSDEADLDLIRYSTDCLIDFLEADRPYKDWRVVMNYPGIGNGRLTEEQVAPIIQKLPDNVWVCKR